VQPIGRVSLVKHHFSGGESTSMGRGQHLASIGVTEMGEKLVLHERMLAQIVSYRSDTD
jgi:hypothetical protein